MKQTVLFCLLISYYAAGLAQTGKVTGIVSDAGSKTPLELATVSILKQDSSLVAYQLSDKEGKFTISKLPLKQRLLVSVTYTGYVSFFSGVELQAGKTDTLTVMLEVNTKDSNAVVVRAVSPVRMNGDTLEINPDAFKMKEDAVVEELLNQVSGVTMWSDGTITLNGKLVQSLLVDGKPFLGSSDSRVATQNLPKSAIDKIQLYQEYDRSNISQTGRPQDSLLTMNIKLKETSKRGYFGKAGAGFGTTNRFESDLSFQMYNKQTSAGIGGGINNINKSIGNVQEMFQNNTYRTNNPNLYNVGRFGTNGINRNYSAGGVLTHSFIEAANSRQNNRVVVNYNTSGVESYLADISLQNRTTIDNPQFIRDEGTQRSRSQRHDLGLNYVKTNSYNDNLNLNGSLNQNTENGNSGRFTEVRDSVNRLQSTNTSNSLFTRKSNSQSFNGSFSKSDYEDPLKGVSIQFNARNTNSNSERSVLSNFQSFTSSAGNNAFNRRYVSNDQNSSIGASVDYLGLKRLLFGRYNLFGINLNLNQSVNLNRTVEESLVSDFDSTSKQYVINNKVSYQNRREVLEYVPALGLSKSFFRYTDKWYRSVYFQARFMEDFRTDKNGSATFAKRNLDRSFQFFRQEGNVTYQYVRQQKYQYFLTANYAKNYLYPSIEQLYTIVDDINVYDIRVGNPGLQNTINHSLNMNANFNTQNPKSLYSVNSNLNGGYNKALNLVTDSLINDPSGKRISYYTNAGESENYNLNYNLNVSRRFKKNSIQLMYNGQFRTGRIPNYIDGFYNVSETNNFSNMVNLQLSLGSTFIFTASQTLQQFKSRQTAAGLTSFKNANKITKLGVVINSGTNFTFSSTLDQIDNSNLNKPTMLWNAFATYRFWKRQAELKGSAMDILKQYQNITNSVNAYGTTTRVTNGLQQYFLLTLSYYPRKFGKTELKRQGN
ncbi:TonB-dependent receptor [Segetibacter sp. 3557_3]|uniref:TonB-dependent receptor n=1 Tax=Segetibacter sp. 3557_3 TaxID=2547429 RepID=UPI0010586142|nr:TonB-dependent receptor [Segetibacter sp. 3557_3]TDH29092.1 TonB-dependent receptor [Segetibacter sp. 3557_3]